MGLLLNTWCKYITTGLEIKTFARVYVNLQLSVNEKFVAYETIIKILATLKSSRAKVCYLIQKLEPTIERMYFGNKFFLL